MEHLPTKAWNAVCLDLWLILPVAPQQKIFADSTGPDTFGENVGPEQQKRK